MKSISPFFGALLIGLIPSLLTTAPLPVSAADPAPSEVSSALSDAQKAAVENVVRELLTKKEPQIVMEAAKEVQARMEKESTAKSSEALGKNKEKLANDPTSPIGGNPKGDVAVVEFYDYQCGYCKTAEETVVKLIASDKNIKFVYKEFPILSEQSLYAAKASLASVKQGKFQAFHEALLKVKEHLTEDLILKTAKEVGLDTDKLKKDMADPAIEKTIKANLDLGREVGARGTPSFIIGDKLMPGLASLDQMKAMVEDARKAKK